MGAIVSGGSSSAAASSGCRLAQALSKALYQAKLLRLASEAQPRSLTVRKIAPPTALRSSTLRRAAPALCFPMRFLVLPVLLLLSRVWGADRHGTGFVHAGMCDASAAVALDDRHFIAASDEESVLRVYANDQDGPPTQIIDLTAFLQTDPKHPETDIEGATRVGDIIYWITSHTRNRDGRERASRYRFFATRVITNAGAVTVRPEGQPQAGLLHQILNEPKLAKYRLSRAAQLSPKVPGSFNIEGLCATPEGHLLICLRSPLADGRAILVPLANPAEVVQGRAARFLDPIELNLKGEGIRDIQFADSRYILIAGEPHGRGNIHVYRWHGIGREPKMVKHSRLKQFNAEAVVLYPGRTEVQLLSDDGRQKAGGTDCKDSDNTPLRRFRSLWLNL